MLIYTLSMTYSQLIKLATWASVVAAISLIGVKTWGWDQTQSVSLLASLIDSTMDSAASLINFFAIRYAMALLTKSIALDTARQKHLRVLLKHY